MYLASKQCTPRTFVLLTEPSLNAQRSIMRAGEWECKRQLGSGATKMPTTDNENPKGQAVISLRWRLYLPWWLGSWPRCGQRHSCQWASKCSRLMPWYQHLLASIRCLGRRNCPWWPACYSCRQRTHCSPNQWRNFECWKLLALESGQEDRP